MKNQAERKPPPTLFVLLPFLALLLLSFLAWLLFGGGLGARFCGLVATLAVGSIGAGSSSSAVLIARTAGTASISACSPTATCAAATGSLRTSPHATQTTQLSRFPNPQSEHSHIAGLLFFVFFGRVAAFEGLCAACDAGAGAKPILSRIASRVPAPANSFVPRLFALADIRHAKRCPPIWTRGTGISQVGHLPRTHRQVSLMCARMSYRH